MNKKYFLATVIALGILGLAACQSLTKIDKSHEKIVNCDADLPLDELHKCIEKKAEKYNPTPKYKDEKLYQTILKDTPTKKIDYFNSIKHCYEKDKCIFTTPIEKKGDLIVSYPAPCRYDDFNRDVFLFIASTNRWNTNSISICTDRTRVQRHNDNTVFEGNASRYKYVETGIIGNDFVIAKENGKENIYAVTLNAVALSKKYLIITNVLHLSPLNVEERLKKEGYTYPYELKIFQGGDWRKEENWKDISLSELEKIKDTEGGFYRIRDAKQKLPETSQQFSRISLDLRNKYCIIGGYRFYEVKDSKDIKDISISLDKRENPSKIYIKQDADVYEIDIKH